MNKNSSSRTTSARESDHARDGRGDGSTSPAFRSLPPLNFASQPPPPGTPATVRQMAPAGLLSPLKIFGQAKRYVRVLLLDAMPSNAIHRFCLFPHISRARRKINEIFVDMGSYSRESHKFLQELKVLKPEILPPDSTESIADYASKINGINEVLARDHMKVAFFGRTSNGKSTVINAMLHRKILPSGMEFRR